MEISRAILPQIEANLGQNKVLVITGARRVGKTYLLDQLCARYTPSYVRLNGDLPETTQLLSSRNLATYKRMLGNSSLLIVDEAQVVPEIGKALKILIDEFKALTIVATGSSSFELSNRVGEPLTGRQIQFHLYPVAQIELMKIETAADTVRNLDERLIYGSYPELLSLTTDQQKQRYLQELVNSYLLKDILIFEQVRNSYKLLQLLQLIAHQVGQEVSHDELGKQLGMSKDTVTRYLDLLSKTFVIYRVGAFSSNLRKEVVKSSKWYFVDNGIRNALIGNFVALNSRSDAGFLWENYLMVERLKRNRYRQETANAFFWRTYDRQEIDLVEEANGAIRAFEFKWREQKARAPIFFTKSYPRAPFEVITRSHYLDFIT